MAHGFPATRDEMGSAGGYDTAFVRLPCEGCFRRGDRARQGRGQGHRPCHHKQSEADEKRGRALRKQEERLGALDRKYRRALRDCDDGDARACDRARVLFEEMERLPR